MLFVLCGVFGNFLASAAYLFDTYTGAKKEAIYAELQEMRARRAAAQTEAAPQPEAE